MPEDLSDLDQMQRDYKAAVDHTVAEIDKWENSAFLEDEARNKARAAKKQYEDALREKFYHF